MSEPLSNSGAKRQRVEWPTMMLAAAIYSLFAAITLFYESLPWWALLPAGAYTVAWHSSLQHEVAHGHPTAWPWLNRLIVLPNLWLWMPFEFYRESHLVHHRDEDLTIPGKDPESFYRDPKSFAATPRAKRIALTTMNSLAGRMLLHPFVCFFRFYRDAFAGMMRGEDARWPVWRLHALGIALPLLWATQVAGMAIWEYLLFFAYPGFCLALLRSFLEHRAVPEERERTVIVEAGPLFSLLFLNNNLHAVHHDQPGLPWYRLPAAYRENRQSYLARNGGYRYAGYLEIALRYLFRAKEPVPHPGFLQLLEQPVMQPNEPAGGPGIRPAGLRAES